MGYAVKILFMTLSVLIELSDSIINVELMDSVVDYVCYKDQLC